MTAAEQQRRRGWRRRPVRLPLALDRRVRQVLRRRRLGFNEWICRLVRFALETDQ